MKNSTSENIRLLRSYHDKLIADFNKLVEDGETLQEGKSDESTKHGDYIDYPCSLAELLKDKIARDEDTEKRLSGDSKKSVENETTDFGFLLISLSRMVPFVDKFVKKICEMNIGEDVVSDENAIQAMESALVWLHCQSTDKREMAYQDMQKLYRFFRYQIIRYKQNNNLPITLKAIDSKYNDVMGKYRADKEKTKQKIFFDYRDDVRKILSQVFGCFSNIHAYYDYMKLVSRDEYENADLVSMGAGEKQVKKEKQDWNREYKMIYQLAETIQNVILQRFSSFVKAGYLNFPHGDYAFADFKSSTLSDSNFTSSNFYFCDFSEAVVKGSDLSVSDLKYVNAQNADFSNSNFNSSSLVGANFNNAILSNAQMMSAMLRDVKLDYLTSNAIDAKGSDSLKESLDAYNKGKDQCESELPIKALFWGKIREGILQKYAKDAQDFEAPSFTDEWKSTTSSPIKHEAIKMHGSMDEACRVLFENSDLNEFLNRNKYKTIDSETLKKYAEYTEANGITDIASPYTASFKDATMLKAQMPLADLSHVDMSSVSMSGTDVNDADLYYTRLSNASLIETNFSSSRFYKTNLRGANLSKANLIGTSIIDTGMDGANLEGALLIDSVIYSTEYGQTKKSKNSVPYINELFSKKAESLVEDVDDKEFLDDVSMADCNMTDIVGTGLVLINTNVDRSTWTRAELKKSILFNTVARWSIFDEADLSYALLLGASFHQTSFSGALMSNARFYACDMSGARLNKANFIGSRIDKVFFQNADLGQANLSRAYVKDCVFKDVNLYNINLSDTEFVNVTFENVDFSNCIGLSTAKFTHCFFADSCSRLEFQTGADGKQDSEFMSLCSGGGRLKFFKDKDQDYKDSFGEHQYTSLTAYLSGK